MVFTIVELFHILVSSLIITYIFDGLLGRSDFKLSAAVSIPALVLHELAHKFTAMMFGYSAQYVTNYFGLLIGVVFKQLGLPIFFIPAYVSIIPIPFNKIALTMIALSGPLTNLLLYLITFPADKYYGNKYYETIYLTRRINLWLFILNILPLWMTDGAQALKYLLT